MCGGLHAELESFCSGTSFRVCGAVCKVCFCFVPSCKCCLDIPALAGSDRKQLRDGMTEQVTQTKTATEAPSWYALLILLRYRTKNNYMSPSYLGSRLLDKAIYTFLIFTFYWHVGKNLSQQNVPNIGGMLFFW